MLAAGKANFFDGVTSARRLVRVELAPEDLVIRDDEHRDILARWRYDRLDHLVAPEDVLRLGEIGARVPARLEVRDADLAHKIDEASVPVDRSGATERRGRLKVIAWSVVAMTVLVAVAVYGVPALADKIAPLVPLSAERFLGNAVDGEIRRMLDTGNAKNAFECGAGPGEAGGRAAFAKLIGRLETASGLPVPLDAKVVRRAEANAVALPGGRIYVFEGLVEKAENSDELAGVIAHEIGHVAHRDGTRSILQSAGLSFLFGVLLGDFVGGSAVVIGARAVLRSSYTRDVEGAADVYGVDLMPRAGADPRALGSLLTRIAGAIHPGMEILRDHPDTKARVAVINALSGTSAPSNRLLEPSEWAALKLICKGR